MDGLQHVAHKGMLYSGLPIESLTPEGTERLGIQNVAVNGCDGVSDVIPPGVDGLINPLQELVIAGLGMPILDNLDLEAVAEAANERNRSSFCLWVRHCVYRAVQARH